MVLYKGEQVAMDKIQSELARVPGVSVQASPEENTFYVRLPGLAEDIRGLLETNLKDRGVEIEQISSVGPKVGGSLRTAGLVSTLIAMGLLLVYVAFRFDFAYAPGAVLCVFHDAAIVLGVWVVTQQEFGLPMISAILTLVGYSLNDTIVTYDRIRENSEKYRRKNLPELINDSVNQTLSRTLITNGATSLAIIPFMFLGGPILQQFAIAMMVGMVAGTYSTIYIASSLMILLKENQDMLLGWVGIKRK
jgi:preprotein translocase subunit SecF